MNLYFQWNNRLSYFMKFFTWLFIFLAILEIFTRNFIIKFPYQHFVPGTGFVPLDNSVTVWGVEGYGITHYLSNGEIFTPYDSGASVVVLGDSYTQALQVSDNQKYVSVAEIILNEGGKQVNMHNLGTPGSSIADYVYIAPFIQRTYSPDIVVVQLSESDFIESLDSSRQNFFVRNEMSLELIHNFNYFTFDLDLQNIIRSTGLGSLAVYKLTPVIKEQRRRLAAVGTVKVEVPSATTGSSNSGGSEIPIEMQIDSLVTAYSGAELVFLIIPKIPVVQEDNLVWNNESDDRFIKIMSQLSDSPLLYPREGFIELYANYKKFPRGFSNTLPNTGHMNSDGNFVVGTALADYLEGAAK